MHKFLKIVVGLLSLAGIISLFRIVAKGDEEIKALAAAGDTSLIEPMNWIGYLILGLTLALVVLFVFKNLFTGGGNIKSTLIGIGAFAAVLIIGYLVSGGDAMQYKYDDVVATAGKSQLVGGGLVAFYILSAIAILAMLFSGVKKLIK